jgi:hypothetical protein
MSRAHRSPTVPAFSTSQHYLLECSASPSAQRGSRIGQQLTSLSNRVRLRLADITLTTPFVNVSVQALSQHEIADEQVKVEETQRIFGIVPNYYAVYDRNVVPLSPKLKFSLAWKIELDPFSVFASGVIAGVQQRQNDFPVYGQGAQGYGKRFAASYSDTFSNIMLSGAILPVLLHQDPRYSIREPEPCSRVPSMRLPLLSSARDITWHLL